MKINSNIDKIIKKLELLAASAHNIDASAALTQGVNAGRGMMNVRIFNQGKDKNQVSFGKYVGRKYGVSKRRFKNSKKEKKRFKKNIPEGEDQFTEYEKKRLAAGRQIAYKDLEFHGELRRAIITAQESERYVVCAINNKHSRRVADGQERQIGKIRGEGSPAEIFELSDEERQEVKDQTKRALKQLYVSILRT